MRTIELIQGDPEWLQWRAGRITATDASVLMDLNPYKTLMELWQEKLSIRSASEHNARMQRGHELEPIARKLFIEETGIEVSPICGEHDTDWWMAASFDGLSECKKIVCEIKCPKMSTHQQALSKQIPDYYYAQCQHQLYVCGGDINYYTSYHPDCERKIAIVEVLPNKEFQENLREKSKIFYEQNMCQMCPPNPAWTFSLKSL